MEMVLLVGALVALACLLTSRISSRFGVPMLLLFIGLGLLFGTDGLFKIPFDDYGFAEQTCSVALIFIMFYGGFGTNWREARPVAPQALLLSSVGTILTALLTGAFCHYVLGFSFLEGMLVGAVLSSTDAASVFSILRSKKLSLKDGTASMLEVESGSNDPFAYMLTVILLSLMRGEGGSTLELLRLAAAQVVLGAAFGAALAWLAVWSMRRISFQTAGFDTIFVVVLAVLAYALPSLLGGNGYLSVYLVGIYLGNQNIKNKRALVHFFDGLTGLMQMMIFFLLGLLATPSQMPAILLPALAIFLFLTGLARPLAVGAILTPFRAKPRQQALVAWAGLRGAASIVFAAIVTVDPAYTKSDVFHIAFCVVLLSISLQGTFLPLAARKLHMIDRSGNVLRTFNDYAEDTRIYFLKVTLPEGHPWCGQKIKDVVLPPESLVVMLLRDGKKIVPKGHTTFRAGDLAVLSAPTYRDELNIHLRERRIRPESVWNGSRISELDIPEGTLVIMVRRGGRMIIPNGGTLLREGDVVVLNSTEHE